MGLRDRYTGRRLEGDFMLADDCQDAPCPVCGAETGQQCSTPDPDNPGFAIELSQFVHAERDTEMTQNPNKEGHAYWCASVVDTSGECDCRRDADKTQEDDPC